MGDVVPLFRGRVDSTPVERAARLFDEAVGALTVAATQLGVAVERERVGLVRRALKRELTLVRRLLRQADESRLEAFGVPPWRT